MEMIRHQTPAKYVGVWGDVFLQLVAEEKVVCFIKENSLFVVTPVVDMIYGVGLESHVFGDNGVASGRHGFSPG